MKKKIQKLILLIILLIPAFFLSACEGADLDLLELAFESWAEENGIYENGEYKPANMVEVAIDDFMGDITNSEESVQFDGIAVVRDIEKTDELIEDAWYDHDEDAISKAIGIRPTDWRLREQSDIFQLVERNFAAGFALESDKIIMNQVKNGADCVNLRLQQLKYRESTIEEHIQAHMNYDNVQEVQFETQEELQGIYATGHTPFCDGFK
jgi:hypothetical protein